MHYAFTDSNVAFGELLVYLRQRGFTVGVGHYLRLQELLEKTGNYCSPQDLKTLLSDLRHQSNPAGAVLSRL